VPTEELSSITGLEGKHLRALARQQVTDLRSLADADRRDIYRAMANIRPRPSLELIAQWQAEARSAAADPDMVPAGDGPETDDQGWQTVASFAVIFTQRQVGAAWEHRVEAERTEVEPEQEHQTWAGWDAAPVGNWMASQLNPPRGADGQTQPAQPAQPEDAEPGQADGTAMERTQLSITAASIIAAGATFDLISAGTLVAEPPAELTAPVRVIFTVRDVRQGTAVQAVIRVLRRPGPGWNPQAPVQVQPSGQAEFDLAGIPAGQYELSLIAWAPDATARPVSVRLPALTITAA
jgi:hypothetical protein